MAYGNVLQMLEAFAKGRDPSIEKAVDVLLGELQKAPRGNVIAPPAPDTFGGEE